MDRDALAALLAGADAGERADVLARHAEIADLGLAHALKELYYATNTSEPQRASAAAAALGALAHANEHPEIQALAAWTAGMAAVQIEGQIERAIERLDDAAARFEQLGQPLTAAATQVSNIYALAMLGRYDEAIECGMRARDVFLSAGDVLQAGKVELNLGNIYRRRDQYPAAEQFYRSAHERFAAAGDARLLAYADNDLANVLNMQHNFRAAEQLYVQALAHVEAAGLEVNRAEIECNLGFLELFRGRYDRALAYLEQSRRRYAELDMPHESAIAELELADAYLELNLAPEAAAIYERVAATFAELGMRAEQAQALLNHGRASQRLGRLDEARAMLAEAHQLYDEEGNRVGAALVTLAEAQVALAEGDDAAVESAAARAEGPIAATGAWGRLLLARWLRGNAARALGRHDLARQILTATLRDAEERGVADIVQRCHTSLGLLAAAEGDQASAEAAFRSAVELIESMRIALPADEFRAAFAADKLAPYTELVRICLADGRVLEALDYVERERSRALADMLGGAARLPVRPRDGFEERLLARLEELREDLSWFYSQINRTFDPLGGEMGEAARSAETMEELYRSARDREARIAEITRQFQQLGHAPLHLVEPLDIVQLQRDLGADTVLVEYFTLDGELLAFVVAHDRVEVVRRLGRMQDVAAALEQLRFQLGTLRHGADRVRAHLEQLTTRAQHYLARLYHLLLRPIEERLGADEPAEGARRLVVVPHRALHYIPFHALFDGARYLNERREVVYAPSASVLHHCLTRPRRAFERALLLGVPDERAPRVRDEVEAIAPLFAQATALLDAAATQAALREQAGAADVVHLACHGQFRPDNPLFSALRLADGWLTVRDAYELDLSGGLVALSACETGVSAVSSGDDLAGLARGFFAAGAPSLLLSLWTVDDASTAGFMTHFYRHLRDGHSPAAALRQAQQAIQEHYPHPFFWSAFALFGRW
jgi:CHAT domain-containing protein